MYLGSKHVPSRPVSLLGVSWGLAGGVSWGHHRKAVAYGIRTQRFGNKEVDLKVSKEVDLKVSKGEA